MSKKKDPLQDALKAHIAKEAAALLKEAVARHATEKRSLEAELTAALKDKAAQWCTIAHLKGDNAKLRA